MTFINGRLLAEDLKSRLKERVKASGIQPGLAVILIGNNPASEVYVDHKHRACHAVGFLSWNHHLPASASQQEVMQLIKNLNADRKVHGILLQLPIPSHLNSQEIIEVIDPRKDVDGLHPYNMGKLMNGTPSLVPCTPQGCVALIQSVEPDLTGLHALIIGRSPLVGKPLAHLLLAQNCTVTIAHSKSINLLEMARKADILVAAVGHPHLVKGNWIKKGAIVIDVGISHQGRKLVGDVVTEEGVSIARAITPVPGGVGPMTVAYLLQNTLHAALEAESSQFVLPDGPQNE